MRRLLLVICLLGVVGSDPVTADGIGVARAQLTERDGNHYTLSVQANLTAMYPLTAPLLPPRCRLQDSERGSGWLRSRFNCDEALTADDTLILPWRGEGTIVTVKWLNGNATKRFFRPAGGHTPVQLAELQARSGSRIDAADRYVALGIEHILLGLDHLLFVLALLLIVRGPWMLVKTLTTFTVSHSLTLALATLGVVRVPSQPVEALIALSIVFLCVDIVHARQGRIGVTFRYPWVVVFVFGLLHGLGFAGAFSEVGVPQQEIPLALLFFNVGVEIGQVIFVVAVMALARVLLSITLYSWPWAREIPCYAIGILAAYWFAQRVAMMYPTT